MLLFRSKLIKVFFDGPKFKRAAKNAKKYSENSQSLTSILSMKENDWGNWNFLMQILLGPLNVEKFESEIEIAKFGWQDTLNRNYNGGG